jgi:zinc/manganese transport system substrate-binding protein
MKKLFLYSVLLLGLISPGFGKIKVVTSYGYIADITRIIGGEEVSVSALASGSMDPHFITPKPSFIAKLRKAELLVINGGQLEIGWLPPVIRQANNPCISPGQDGFLVLMDLVKSIDVPEDVSRARGDVHPEGNPHIQLDPDNIPVFAEALMERLSRLAPDKSDAFKRNYEDFRKRWSEKAVIWEQRLNPLKGMEVVSYHKLYDYLFRRFQIESVETLEPLPGIPPTSRHIADIIDLIKKENIALIVQDVYHSSRTARFISEKTGAKVVILPHDIGAVKEVTDIYSLFDEIVRRLTGS